MPVGSRFKGYASDIKSSCDTSIGRIESNDGHFKTASKTVAAMKHGRPKVV